MSEPDEVADAAAPEEPAVVAPPDDRRGEWILRLSWIGTAVFTVVAVLTTVAVGTFQVALIAVTMLLFVIGLGAFFGAYAIAISRSREVLIGMGGLYFLAGHTAPNRVRFQLLASFGIEIGVATVTSIVGTATLPDDAQNPLAFGFLVPLFGLGLAGLWGARFGAFAPRPPDPPRPSRRSGSRRPPDQEQPDATDASEDSTSG